ncbi:MAG: hypothetical protein K5876_01460 [Ruminiclostridium sp.]|nr:hypothetical protein [Ruminiclostridium sp.]
MKKKIVYALNLLWTCAAAYLSPLAFGLIYFDITGHSKGYAYDLGPEKDVSVMFGCAGLVLGLALTLPSLIYVTVRTKRTGAAFLFLLIMLWLSLAELYVCAAFGWDTYLEMIFNI